MATKPIIYAFLFHILVLKSYSLDVQTVLETTSADNSAGFHIIHRDAPRSPLRVSPTQISGLTSNSLNVNPFKDVISHFQALQTRVKSAQSRHHHHSNHAMQNPVVTLGQAGLEYYMPMQIGTPATEVTLIMDTGSDVSWIQCAPCKDCVPTLKPPFNPKHSSTFHPLPCASSTCKTVYEGVKPSCSPSGKTCLFGVQYADGSLSSGLLALETISANGCRGLNCRPTKVVNVTIGCASVDREGVPTGATGLLGMDRRLISFPSQMSARYGNKFSYCFPNKVTHLNSSGVVFFGESSISPRLRYTPLVKNKAFPAASLDYYYVGLVGISIGGSRLALPDSNFAIQSTGRGGTIVDSGTAFTCLTKPVFEVLSREFLNETSQLTRAEDTDGFAPCYSVRNGEEFDSLQVPSVTMHFLDGLDVVLTKNNLLIPVSGDGEQTTLCFAIQTNENVPFNVIGNYQQQDLWVEYDLDNLRLGMTSVQCAAD